jgi:uncharacterized membrane protein
LTSRPSALIVAMLVLSILGAGITAYLTFEHGRGSLPACVVGHGCEVVAQSSYAHVGPIPSAAFGLLGYLLLTGAFVMRLMRPPEDVDLLLIRATLAMALTGFGVSAFLTVISIFELEATCTFCLASALDLTILGGLTGYVFVRHAVRAKGAEEGEGRSMEPSS